MTPRLGTDGNHIVYPFRGIAQAFRNLGAHPTRRTAIYVIALVVAALATAVALVSAGYTLGPATVLALAVVSAAAERVSIRLTKTLEQSISALPMLFAAVLFGPLAGAAVGAASMLGDPELISRGDPNRAPRLKWATYTSTRFIGGALTGLAAQGMLVLVPTTFGGLVAATLVGAVVSETVDMTFSIITTVVRGGSTADTARTLAPLLVLVPPLYAPIVALLGFMYIEVSPWTLALFLVPAMAAQRLYALYQKERLLAADLSTANETLERANLQFAAALIATLDARDRYTAGTPQPSQSIRGTSPSAWGSPPRFRRTHISAALFTTSARSGYHRVCSRSLER